jgi:hypothetical protein
MNSDIWPLPQADSVQESLGLNKQLFSSTGIAVLFPKEKDCLDSRVLPAMAPSTRKDGIWARGSIHLVTDTSTLPLGINEVDWGHYEFAELPGIEHVSGDSVTASIGVKKRCRRQFLSDFRLRIR